jgi:uncharacterized protein (TIGR02246 family)
MRLQLWLTVVACLSAPLISQIQAAENAGDDESAIRSSIEAYVVAYEKGDAKALAELWSPKGILITIDTHEQANGRAEIEAQFRRIFSQPGKRVLNVDVGSIRFITPDVAAEDGTATVTVGEGEPTATNYTAIHVKRDGRWMLDSVREAESAMPTTPESPLKQVAWLVGAWVDEEPGVNVSYDCRWSKNESFLISNFTINGAGGVDMQGTQIIGWDPAEHSIRSWVFDSDGGFGTGLWTREGDQWVVKMHQVLSDGGLASMTNVYEMVDGNTYRWLSTDRRIGDSVLPKVGPVRITRRAATSAAQTSQSQLPQPSSAK